MLSLHGVHVPGATLVTDSMSFPNLFLTSLSQPLELNDPILNAISAPGVWLPPEGGRPRSMKTSKELGASPSTRATRNRADV